MFKIMKELVFLAMMDNLEYQDKLVAFSMERSRPNQLSLVQVHY